MYGSMGITVFILLVTSIRVWGKYNVVFRVTVFILSGCGVLCNVRLGSDHCIYIVILLSQLLNNWKML